MKRRRRAKQLGRFTLWHNGRRAKQPDLMHASFSCFTTMSFVFLFRLEFQAPPSSLKLTEVAFDTVKILGVKLT